MATLAPALQTLRDQLNKQYPRRSKRSDGWIGDRKHQTRKSDHNPNAMGVVLAIDLTHDPVNGIDCHKLFRALYDTRPPRLAYAIFDGHWFRSYRRPRYQPYTIIPYTGPSRHSKHLHISVNSNPSLYNDGSLWDTDMEPVDVAGTGYGLRLIQQLMNTVEDIHIPVDGQDTPLFREAVKDLNSKFAITRDQGDVFTDTTHRMLLTFRMVHDT